MKHSVQTWSDCNFPHQEEGTIPYMAVVVSAIGIPFVIVSIVSIVSSMCSSGMETSNSKMTCRLKMLACCGKKSKPKDPVETSPKDPPNTSAETPLKAPCTDNETPKDQDKISPDLSKFIYDLNLGCN